MNLKLLYTYIILVIASILLALFIWVVPKKTSTKQQYDLHKYIDIQELKLKDGGSGFLSVISSSDVVSLYIIFKGGTSIEPLNKKGAVSILSAMLLSNKEIKKLLDMYSIHIDINTGIDKVVFNILTTKDNLSNMFNILNLVFSTSNFDNKEFKVIKDNALLNIKLGKYYTSIQGINELYKNLFNEDKHFYNNRGTYNSISNLTISDLVSLKKKVLTKNNIIVGASGKITKDELEKGLNKVFSNLSSSDLISYNNYIKITKNFSNIPVSGSTNSDIYMAIPLPNLSYQCMLSANLVNKYLGSGFNSLLVEEVRVTRGLAYTVGSQIVETLYGNFWLITATTDNKSAKETVEVIKKVLINLKKNNIKNSDIKTIKQYMKNSFLLNFKDNQSIASEVAIASLLNYNKNYIYDVNINLNNITTEDIKSIIDKYINLDNLVIVIAGAKV